ncbi:MAG: hypothetical protein LBQ16_01665, partial [Gracilibacteraceae bacterium]|nr:hypothetical protein [Gracilibacteraceae bacterium]
SFLAAIRHDFYAPEIDALLPFTASVRRSGDGNGYAFSSAQYAGEDDIFIVPVYPFSRDYLVSLIKEGGLVASIQATDETYPSIQGVPGSIPGMTAEKVTGTPLWRLTIPLNASTVQEIEFLPPNDTYATIPTNPFSFHAMIAVTLVNGGLIFKNASIRYNTLVPSPSVTACWSLPKPTEWSK